MPKFADCLAETTWCPACSPPTRRMANCRTGTCMRCSSAGRFRRRATSWKCPNWPGPPRVSLAGSRVRAVLGRGQDRAGSMRTWPHSGFSVDQSVYLSAGDHAGIERLVQYMTRCPFSLSSLLRAAATRYRRRLGNMPATFSGRTTPYAHGWSVATARSVHRSSIASSPEPARMTTPHRGRTFSNITRWETALRVSPAPSPPPARNPESRV